MSASRAIFQQCLRSFRTSAMRQGGHHEPEGFPGANLPFSIDNRYKLLAYFVLFFGSSFSIPFFVIRHQLLK